ncbi:hypothetical protein CRUP_034426 [Coryphaenoides rupestris]|nr:hypothetical protein CRUP_034426 [Coryphaenoides rupestris]
MNQPDVLVSVSVVMLLLQMVMSLRVSELQVLLGYAGRNKHGRKHELLTKALHLLKAGCGPAVHLKIKELYRRRFPAKMVSPSEPPPPPGPRRPGSGGGGGAGSTAAPPITGGGLSQLAYEGPGGAPSPAALLPLSLLGPGKHELSGLAQHHHLAASTCLHPLHPDVKLQRLPFYDLLDELIKPTSLASALQPPPLHPSRGFASQSTSIQCLQLQTAGQRFQETCFAFALTPQQVQQISGSMDISGTKCDFSVQVQLRFCLSETSCPQEDHFPANLCVKVNGKPCNLPGFLPPTKNGVEPKRPSRPINITSLVRLSTTVPNTIVPGRPVGGASWFLLIGSEITIKEKLTADPDSEIATTSLRVSLLCPLGKMRLSIPCRAITCSHLQCFDATLYLQMNEKKPTWVCPVCDKKAPYEHLIIDGLFMEILNSCMDSDEIQFKEDGCWSPMRWKKEVQEVSPASYSNGVDGGGKKVEVIDLTLDSSEDEAGEDDDDNYESQDSPAPPPPPPPLPPPAKRPCPSLSPTSPPVNHKGRTPSMPSVDASYIPPIPPLIQDYRPYYHTPTDLSDLSFFSFLQGDNHQDHELLLNRFLPYGAAAAGAASSSASQLFLDQSGGSVGGPFTAPPTNGSSSSSSSSGSSGGSLGCLRDASSSSTHSSSYAHAGSRAHTHPGVLVGRGGAEASAAAAAIYGGIPDIISLD